MFDDAAVLLRGAGHEAGHVDKGDDRNVECIAKTHKARRLDRALDVQASGQYQRLISDDAHRLPIHAGKADQDVFGVVGLQLKKVAIVHGFDDQLFHVVGFVGVVRDQRVEAGVYAVRRIATLAPWRFFAVGQRQVVVQAAHHQQRLDIVLKSHIGHAAFGGVGDRAAQFLGTHFFVRHGLHHLRAGDEHVRTVFDHEDEVSQRRGIHRTPGRRAHDYADLRHHTAGQHVALEHFGVTTERCHTLLNTRATRIVQADHRSADLHGLVHDLANLLGMRLRQRAAVHGEILAEHKNQAPVDHPVTGHHTVAGDCVLGHAEIGAAVLDEHVPFFEGTFIEQNLQAFARGELALGVLRVNAPLPAALARPFALGFELFKNLLHVYVSG